MADDSTMTMVRNRRRGGHGEDGAALVEFALIFPVFMTIVLGMFTGGITYNRDLSINHAAREGARYGATLAKSGLTAGVGGLDATAWTAAVRDRVVQAAAGDIDINDSGTWVCVALVQGGAAPDGGKKPLVDALGNKFTLTTAGGAPGIDGCYDDGLGALSNPDGQPRVHVQVRRPGKIQGLFFSIDVTLNRSGTARYEA